MSTFRVFLVLLFKRSIHLVLIVLRVERVGLRVVAFAFDILVRGGIQMLWLPILRLFFLYFITRDYTGPAAIVVVHGVASPGPFAKVLVPVGFFADVHHVCGRVGTFAVQCVVYESVVLGAFVPVHH